MGHFHFVDRVADRFLTFAIKFFSHAWLAQIFDAGTLRDDW